MSKIRELAENAIQLNSQVAAGIVLFPKDSALMQDRIEQASKARATLAAAVQELERDAELWRMYKARKDAVIEAGMGRNPMSSDAAIAAREGGAT
jgi:hypothetical protein